MPKNANISGPLNLQGTFTVQAQAPAEDGQKPGNPKFALAAYNGGPMTVAGWKYPVVVDGQGVRCANPNGSVPVYATHEETVANLLGQTGGTTIVQGKIACEGEITGMGADASDACKQVMLHAKNGFQWQCSIGAGVDTAEFIADGKSAVVNGAEVKGPVYVARSTVLGHVAIVPLGADTTTSARIAASAAGEITMTDLEKWINAEFGLDAATLTEPQRTSFQAKYDAAKALEAQKPQPPDPVQKMRLDTGAELRRIDAVRKHAANHPEILAKAVEEGWTVDATELAVLRAGHKPSGTTTAIHAGGVPLTQRVIEAAGIIGGGFKPDALVKDKNYGEQVVEAAMRLSRHGLGPKAVIRLAAQMEGRPLPVNEGSNEWIIAAFSTMSLPTILSNLMNKLLLEGYQYVETSYQTITRRGPVNDFKPHIRMRLTEDFKFLPLGPDGEIKHGSVGEQKYTIQADTKALMFTLGRQAIINDDQSAFADLPRRFSIGAGEAINDLLWTIWLANLMSDGTTPFFSTDNNNLSTGAATALSFDSLSAAYAAFLAQTKPNGRPLGIRPRYLLVPTNLETTALQLVQSTWLMPALVSTTGSAKGTPQQNIFQGKFDVVSSAYLNNAAMKNYSATAWYMLADPVILHTIEAAFLNGQEMPTVERAEADFDTLGISFRSWLDFGVAMGEPRAAQKIAGV
jgi:hypothetical protein